jgi:hypothetical protein
MSTPEERAKTRAKVRRFRARHRGYDKKYSDRAAERKYLNPPPASVRSLVNANREPFRTFELVDPRDPEQLPHIISYCPIEARPVWSLLWACRNYSHARWARWFRTLDKLGLEPVERLGWSVGRIVPLSYRTADMLVRARIQQVCKAVGGVPKWLYNAASSTTPGCVYPDGRVLHFPTLASAARTAGVSQAAFQRYLITSMPMPDGSIWFED